MDPNAALERHVKFYLPGGDVILASTLAAQTNVQSPPMADNTPGVGHLAGID